MPLVDINDPIHLGINVGAEGLWGHPNTRQEVRLTYARFHVIPEMKRRWGWLVPALNLTPASSLIIVGAAYGYQLEVLESDFGITRTVGVETSPNLRTKMSQSEDAEIQASIEAVGLNITIGDGLRLYNALRDKPGLPRSIRVSDILNEDLASNQSRNRVRNAIQAKGGTSWDVITENVLTVLNDSECVTLANRARSVPGINRLIHLVSTLRNGNIPGYNWKTVNDWKALLPLDTIVNLYRPNEVL